MDGDLGNERPLSIDEIAQCLSSYNEVRPLLQDELAAFPIVWAASQAYRLAQDLRIVSKFDRGRAAHWPIAEQMSELPHVVDLGHEIVAAGGVDTRPKSEEENS